MTLVTVAALVVVPTPARAHGDIQDSSPAAGAEVNKPPKEVALVLAEPAAKGSALVVTDGCDREVSGGAPTISGENFTTAVSEDAEPGRWKVALRSISAVDGHVVKASFAFKVSGQKDCSPENDDDDTDISPDTSSRPPIENPDDPTTFPVVPFALGTVAVVAVAVALRRPWNRS